VEVACVVALVAGGSPAAGVVAEDSLGDGCEGEGEVDGDEGREVLGDGDGVGSS
jgi:hypothetical protein